MDGKAFQGKQCVPADLQAILQAIKHHENVSHRVNIYRTAFRFIGHTKSHTSPHPIVRKFNSKNETTSILAGSRQYTGHLEMSQPTSQVKAI
ncbi:hypothetical protein AVEN_262786-1 [Araneus ventricosus]|uniref:Uncharacterized protein n=1 Tax=Araneus ventricosus TaxID=182803 RepID=A0A4Y2LE97_ARAVE|nr:hypothetical protein AVEN_262786-1 [Araneus ventricosus]